VNDRVAWSVGLPVDLSPREPRKKFGSDRDTVCVQDSSLGLEWAQGNTYYIKRTASGK